MARLLRSRAETTCSNDCGQGVDRTRKLLINNNIVEVYTVTYLFARGFETAIDLRPGVLSPLLEPSAQHRERRRQNEYPHGRCNKSAYLPRSLPVDLEQHV